MRIARFESSYWDDMYEICLRTGNKGQDGCHLYSDPQILGHIYTGPYLELCPDFALMLLDDRDKVVGYCLAALDSDEFFARVNDTWVPRLQKKYDGIDKNAFTQRDLECLALIYDYPSYHFSAQYPSHLHIDLLPEAQGRGMGRALIQKQCQQLADSRGIHLVLDADNHKAYQFYQRMGFRDFTVEGIFTKDERVMVL